MALARSAAGQREQGQRVGHLSAGHGQVANQFVDTLPDDAQLLHVAQHFARQVGMPAKFQGIGPVGLGDQHNGRPALVQLLLRIRLDLADEPVHVALDDFHGFPEEPGRFTDEHAPGTAQVKVHRVNVKAASIGRVAADGFDRGLEPGRAGPLNGPQLVTAVAVAGDKAVRRHFDLLAFGFLWDGNGRGRLERRKALLLEVSRGAAEEKIVDILDPFRPADDMDLLDQRRQDFLFQPGRGFLSRLVVVKTKIDFGRAVLFQKPLVVVCPAVGPIQRNHVAMPGLPQAHAVQNRLGDEQRLMVLGRNRIPDAAMRAGQIQVLRLVVGDAPAVNAGDGLARAART